MERERLKEKGTLERDTLREGERETEREEEKDKADEMENRGRERRTGVAETEESLCVCGREK